MRVVIVGASEVGFHIASHLTLENKEVVVIDKNADAIRRVSDKLDVQVVQGSGSSPVVLEEAGIRNAEVMEALALETSDIVDKPLKQISFPKGAIVAGIIRKDDIIIPNGDSLIRPEDRVIIFARRQAIPMVEKMLSVKLEYF